MGNKNESHMERWIDLGGLPRKHGFVDWINSVGHNARFQYDEFSGVAHILQADLRSRNLKVFIENYTLPDGATIPIYYFQHCMLERIFNRIICRNPSVIPYLDNIEDAYRYPAYYQEKIKMHCPYCGEPKEMKPSYFYYKNKFPCSKCGDGYSIPNKIMKNILEQFHIDFIPEVNKKHFAWIDKYRYDFYFRHNNQNVIIEMDGAYHRYQQNIDAIKTNLARQHNFNIIRIDSDYVGDPLSYIKDNILKSELAKIWDLSLVDWRECENAMVTSGVRIACQLWERDECDISEIASILRLDRHTIRYYLQRGNSIGLCPSYNTKESAFRSHSKCIAVYKDGMLVRAFRHVNQLCEMSLELFGSQFNNKSVRMSYCNNMIYKGFIIQNITREEYLQYKMIDDNEVVLKEAI